MRGFIGRCGSSGCYDPDLEKREICSQFTWTSCSVMSLKVGVELVPKMFGGAAQPGGSIRRPFLSNRQFFQLGIEGWGLCDLPLAHVYEYMGSKSENCRDR
jgi:hypothetical protein